MSNITNLNRDYLIKINVKEATIDVPKMTFWNTDKKTSNMFVQLVINMSTNELISQYVTVQNATDYKITLNVIKPKTKQYKTIEATLLNEEKALFEIDLPDEFTDQVGDYSFEFEVSSKVDSNDESITTSNGTYKVNGSILTNLNEETSSSPDLPILKQLIEQVKSLQGGDLTGYQKKEDETLETTSKKVVGAINEVNTQFKDIAKQTITTEERTKLASLENYNDTTVKTNIQSVQQQVNNLVLGAVGDGNNPEVVQARGTYNTLNDRLDYSDSLLPKTLISSKNLYAYNSTYAGKHYKYVTSNGYYVLNDESNYSTIFIPVSPGKYTMQLFSIAPALGIIEFELFYLSVNNMNKIENGINSGVTIGDKLQFNDGYYGGGLINKLSFTIPDGNIMLAITGITELLTENHFKIQLEINDGTDTYEKHSDSYEIVRLKNSPYLEKSDFDAEKTSVNSNIANITKEIEALKNTTNINTYTIKNYKIGIQNEPTMYESTIETKLLEERDTSLIDNPTTISSVIDGNANMFFNYFRSPMALKNNYFITSSSTDYAKNGRGGFNRIGFSTDAPAFDIFIYGIMRYRLLVNEGDGWKYINSKNPVNIGTNDGSFRWVNFNFKTSLIRQFILETNDPFGGVRYNQNYSIFPLVENSKPLTVWTGSSITEGSAVTNFQGMSFAALTSNKLGMNWIDVGVGATGYLQTVAENGRKKLRDRFSTDVYPLKPDLLIIEGGINDFSFPIEDIKTEVQSCINDVKTNISNTYLVLIGVYFPSGSGYSTADDINTAIREIASLNNIPFIDLLKGEIIGTDGTVLIKLNPFIDNNRKTTYLNLSEDQTHLNTVGHEAMKEFLTIALMNILK